MQRTPSQAFPPSNPPYNNLLTHPFFRLIYQSRSSLSLRGLFLTAESADDTVYLRMSMDSRCAFCARGGRPRTTMDGLDRAVGSNPNSSASPLNRLGALVRRFSTDVLFSTNDSRTWKVLCFLSLLAFVSLVWKFIFIARKSYCWIHARLLCVTRPFSFFATRNSDANTELAVCQAGDSSKDSRICSLRTLPIVGKGLPLGHIAVWVLAEGLLYSRKSTTTAPLAHTRGSRDAWDRTVKNL
jgi:hypothetical protein